MEKYYKVDYLGVNIMPFSILYKIIMIIMLLLGIIIDIRILIIFLLILIYSIYLVSKYENEEIIIKKNIIKESLLREENKNFKNTFEYIINNKNIEVILTEYREYIEDSKDNMYLILEEITYIANKKWYLSSIYIKEINNHKKLILKELHY